MDGDRVVFRIKILYGICRDHKFYCGDYYDHEVEVYDKHTIYVDMSTGVRYYYKRIECIAPSPQWTELNGGTRYSYQQTYVIVPIPIGCPLRDCTLPYMMPCSTDMSHIYIHNDKLYHPYNPLAASDSDTVDVSGYPYADVGEFVLHYEQKRRGLEYDKKNCSLKKIEPSRSTDSNDEDKQSLVDSIDTFEQQFQELTDKLTDMKITLIELCYNVSDRHRLFMTIMFLDIIVSIVTIIVLISHIN